jgi:hypothetical protein
MPSNFDLLNMAFFYLQRAKDEDRGEQINGIGLSGYFDSPFYAVGAAMIRSLGDAFGRDALLCLMAAPPEQFFLAYQQAAEKTGGQSLGEHVTDAARRLSTRQSRAAGAACLAADSNPGAPG